MHEYITQHFVKVLSFYKMIFLLVLPPVCQITPQKRGQRYATSLLAAA